MPPLPRGVEYIPLLRLIDTAKPDERQKMAFILGGSQAKQSVSNFICEFTPTSTDLQRPVSTGQCSLTALGANPNFIAFGK